MNPGDAFFSGWRIVLINVVLLVLVGSSVPVLAVVGPPPGLAWELCASGGVTCVRPAPVDPLAAWQVTGWVSAGGLCGGAPSPMSVRNQSPGESLEIEALCERPDYFLEPDPNSETWIRQVTPASASPPASAASGAAATEASVVAQSRILSSIFWAVLAAFGFAGYGVGSRDA